MVYKVELLNKEKWKNYILDNGYRSEEYYDVELSEDSLHNVNLKLTRNKLTNPIVHTSEEYDFPDKLYENCVEKYSYEKIPFVENIRTKKFQHWKLFVGKISS